MKSKRIAFIGGGNMASSLIGGLIADDYDPTLISVSEPDAEKRAKLAASFGIHTSDDNAEATQQADVVVLAVKPQMMSDVCQALAPTVNQTRPLLISIAAGIREQNLKNWLGEDAAIVRTMPNTPAMIQSGATVLHASEEVSTQQKDLAESVMRAVGVTQWIKNEELMDAVTALSGSGPAYFFRVMEAMENAGIDMGLDAKSARLLTLQTALGAARMAIESSDSPSVLRQKVTSPGGTTERALSVLDEANIGDLFKEALRAARDRSEEMSNILGDK